MSSENITNKEQFKVSWPGHDEITLEFCPNSKLVTSLKVNGCFETINKFKYLAQTLKARSIFEWPLPLDTSHSSMLIRELLLKIRGQWDFPYKAEELCHCRSVPTIDVDRAIMGGAHTAHQVTLATSAASACGTCQVHIDKIINYRLKKTS